MESAVRKLKIHYWCGLVLWSAGLCHAARAANAPQPPRGWRMELVAQAPEIRHPTVVCVAPDGRVFVAEDPMDISTAHADAQEGRILCLHPDGRGTIFAEKLHAVFGMQYLEGKLYVLHNPHFSVFTDDDARYPVKIATKFSTFSLTLTLASVTAGASDVARVAAVGGRD